MTTPESPAAFGANSWLVEEMYEQFRADPDSVSDTWRPLAWAMAAAWRNASFAAGRSYR